MMNHQDMIQQMERGDGFIAALDQSGGSTPKALAGYGYEGGEWSNDEEMFGLIHDMRSRIIRSPAFSSGLRSSSLLASRKAVTASSGNLASITRGRPSGRNTAQSGRDRFDNVYWKA